MPWNDSRIFAAGGLGSISGTVNTFTTGLGLQLGEERWYNGIKYRLTYNAGGASITAGYLASPLGAAAAATPYSVSVTTTSGAWMHFGAVCAHNATVPTASYFWGAVWGYLASGLVMDATTFAVLKPIMIGADGKCNGAAAIATGFVSGNIACGYCTTAPAGGTAAVRQGGVFLTLG